MKIFKMFKDKNSLVNEVIESNKERTNAEIKLEEISSKLNERSEKYISLLEQKSEKFDLYLEYQNQSISLANDKKELKKELAETNELCFSLTMQNSELQSKIDKLERKIKRLESKNEKSA